MCKPNDTALPALFRKYFLLLLSFFQVMVAVAQALTNFTSVAHDLVNNEVTAIISDPKGFVWFGTRGGLQRFDGYEMKLLKNDVSVAENLKSQSIEVVLASKKYNCLWIGTKSGGISKYDLKTGATTNFSLSVPVNGSFNEDYILSLLETNNGKLLVGTWQGLGCLDIATATFTIIDTRWKTFDIQADGNNGYWIATNSGLKHLDQRLNTDAVYDFGTPAINITAIVKDEMNKCLWLGTWDRGLIQFNTTTKAHKAYLHNAKDASTISSNNTYKLLLDTKGDLWIGTWGGGLNRFNITTNTFDRFHLNIPGIYTTDDQIILSMMEDSSGLLWVGTDGSGVFKFDINQKRFNNIRHGDKNLLQGSTHVLSVFVDSFNHLWLSTKGGAIQYSTYWNNFTKVKLNHLVDKSSLRSVFEGRMFLQVDNTLFIATNKGLVTLRNQKNSVNNFKIYLPDKSNPNAISDRKITSLIQSTNRNIWIGTQEKGLSVIQAFTARGTPVFKNYLPAYGVKGALQNERVSCLLEDSKGRLWIGTYKGLHLYHPNTDNFSVYFQTNQVGKSITNNTILCLTEDVHGNIWVGTQSGLNKITNIVDGALQVSTYTRKDGLPNDYIHAVIADKKGIIWATTNKGIVRLNPTNNSIALFDKRDGIASVVFSENASFKKSNGQFFFGGIEGVTFFHPDSINVSNYQPPIYFTNLTVNNQPYETSNQATNTETHATPFTETQHVVFNYQQNIFSIQFAALDYHAPDKNLYMYKLQGFHSDWVFAGNTRTVSFTNLKPGTYTLHVKATNSDKVWNAKETTLSITVLPPPWKTWWAYTFYIALFIFLLWLTRHSGLRQEALKSQLQLTKLARQQENQLADFKERLFTNISHEFRTPLTLILGPLEDMMQQHQLEKPIAKSLRLIQKQSKRMLRMVNQLLDFQKAEAGSLKLSPQSGEIVTFCYDVYMLFSDEAARRKINYVFETNEKYISFVFDDNKLEIILYNMLSNAFKYAQDGATIRLNICRQQDKSCEISVSDTGVGIKPDELEHIFDRFYRGRKTDATTISGTGIGLSFVKELVTLHRGTIRAESDGVSGSTFIVHLPSETLDTPILSISGEPLLQSSISSESQLKHQAMQDEINQNAPEQERELPIILVVEDESDMLAYISDILSTSYNVITAVNGRLGIEKALEAIPDLIVSDVMMPEVNGIELCRTLKSDKTTSHVPIILLTALNDMQHHVQGIQEGADVYLPKPFNSQLLLVHIHNLINLRNTLKDLYAKKVFLGSGNFEIQSYEEEFLNKLMKHVEDNIANGDFNNDELANLMYMSRSTFYRKLKAVTGMSGNEFIRTARLNYAGKLLESGKYTVSEAAYES
ncbi:MAG TPA: hypothetical protein DCL43_12450, partial [Chitinophagaceae bacterium]|nr:hypothetical protein [Chitinophagaceae bacterium]